MVGDDVELWVRLKEGEAPLDEGLANRYLSDLGREDHLTLVDGVLSDDTGVIGAHIRIEQGSDQADGVSLIGSVDWILVECTDWSMIPLENLIASRTGSHTKIAAFITSPLQAQGAGFALQEGVDALVVPNDVEMIDAALSVRAQRQESEETATPIDETTEQVQLVPLIVASVEQAGVGDRYCLDFLSHFHQGEGVLVGSSAACMVLIHSETIPSTFVPTRPFRVNAGAPHSYIMMADGTTKYMADLASGDVVLAVSTDGSTRPVVLGRLKIEPRPMLKIVVIPTMNNEQKPNESHVYMQQAETVRLLSDLAEARSVTSLESNEVVLGWIGHGSRHLGKAIGGHVEER